MLQTENRLLRLRTHRRNETTVVIRMKVILMRRDTMVKAAVILISPRRRERIRHLMAYHRTATRGNTGVSAAIGLHGKPGVHLGSPRLKRDFLRHLGRDSSQDRNSLAPTHLRVAKPVLLKPWTHACLAIKRVERRWRRNDLANMLRLNTSLHTASVSILDRIIQPRVASVKSSLSAMVVIATGIDPIRVLHIHMCILH